MESAGKNITGTSNPPRSTMRTRRQVAAEKRKAEEELMRAEEEKRSKSLFAPGGDGRMGTRDILIGQEDPVEVKAEVKLKDPEGEGGQIGRDGGFEQIGKVEENVVIVKYEEMIDDSEGATAGEHLVEKCFSLDEEEIFGEEEPISGKGEAIFGEEEAIAGEEEAIAGEGEAISGEGEAISGEEEAIAGEEEAIAGEGEAISGEGEPISGKGEAIFGEEEAIAGEGEAIAGEGEAIAGEGEAIAGEEEAIAGEEEAISGIEEVIADEEEIAGLNITVEEVLPFILPLLNQKDVFRCRLVNKLWRRMVDEFLEDCLVPQHYDDQAFLQKVKSSPSQLCPLPRFRIVKSAYEFNNEDSLRKFNEVMAPHADLQLSPFVGGATVSLSNLFVASSRLSQATEQFLEKFGVHIRRLAITQGDYHVDFDIIGFVDCVKKCLRYVPNLEKLKISGRRIPSTTPDFRLELYRIGMLDRMPKLDKLYTLEFQSLDHITGSFPHSPYLDEIFGDMMIKPYYQTQLRNLSLDWPTNRLKFKLPNVKELSFANVRCEYSEVKVRAPVQKLTVPPYEEHGFEEIFRKFPHLCYLKLGNMSSICLDELNFTENNVHTLEIMDIGLQDFILDDIIHGFAKLRYLILHSPNQRWQHCRDHLIDRQHDREFVNGRVKISHLSCGRTSYDSNLWTSLPQLEIFTLQFQSYCDSRSECGCWSMATEKLEDCSYKNIVETREGYLRYQERVLRICATSQTNYSTSQDSKGEKKNKNTTISAVEKDNCFEPQVLPLVLPFLNPGDVFKCRKVSKQWRGMVDAFVKKFVVPEHYDDKAYLKRMDRTSKQVCPLPKFRNVECAYRFMGERELEHFNERMEGHVDLELSPFVGGATVTLDNLFLEYPAPLLTPAVQKFLEEFGVHIQNLVIRPTVFDVVRFVECLKLCLQFVPNLERLKLCGNCTIEQNPWKKEGSRSFFYENEKNLSDADKIQLEVYRNDLNSPMPKLNELTSLELEFCNTKGYPQIQQTLPSMNEIFCDMMIKPLYQTQLKKLQIVGSPVRNVILNMCNLKELTLKVSRYEPKKIVEGKWLEAPVEKLNLIICIQGDHTDSMKAEVFNILRVFPLVRHLKIENFDLIFPVSYMSSFDAESSIPANNIHTLELTKLDKCDSISDAFFRGFSKLRSLIFRDTNVYGRNDLERASPNCQTVPENETAELNIPNLFSGGTTYDTNVWQLLPALEVFTFQLQSHQSRYQWCSCKRRRTKDQCPFKNIVETRRGYQMYLERMSRISGEN